MLYCRKYFLNESRLSKLERLLHAQVPVSSWFDDMSDTELLDLIPFFERLAQVDTVYALLHNANTPMHHNSNFVVTTTTTVIGNILSVA